MADSIVYQVNAWDGGDREVPRSYHADKHEAQAEVDRLQAKVGPSYSSVASMHAKVVDLDEVRIGALKRLTPLERFALADYLTI